MQPPRNIETARLRLRPPLLSDAKEIFVQYAQDPDVTRYMTWRPHQTIEDTRAILQQIIPEWEQGTSFPWVIERKTDQQLLGMLALRIHGHRAEIGYVLARSAWGQGYAPEAAGTVVEWALAQPGIYRAWAVCDQENSASARVLEKIGMQREGLLRRWIVHPNVSDSPRDCWCYARVR